MTIEEFRREVLFGLENLERVRSDIDSFQTSTAPLQMRNSALAYAAMGYFNALEHLMIRLLKFLGIALPIGPASHQKILELFQNTLNKINVQYADFDAIKRLLGFRHVATKIYGFLIDEEKLTEVIATIQVNHAVFVDLFNRVAQKVAPTEP